jgi:uncharacterized protein DUF2510
MPPPEGGQPGYYPDPLGGKKSRYFDGTQWTSRVGQDMEAVVSAPMAVKTDPVSEQERKAILAQQVQQAVARGLRVESQTDFQAVLIEGQKVNHTLHAILTIFTCLLWGIVWAVIAGTGGERREMIVVDEFGNVQHQKLGKV